VQGFNNIQENQPRTAASKRSPTATNAFEVGKKFRQYVGALARGSLGLKKREL